jgi:hypothetical protein
MTLGRVRPITKTRPYNFEELELEIDKSCFKRIFQIFEIRVEFYEVSF